MWLGRAVRNILLSWCRLLVRLRKRNDVARRHRCSSNQFAHIRRPLVLPAADYQWPTANELLHDVDQTFLHHLGMLGCRTIVMKKIHADPFDPLRGIGPGSDGPLARTGPHGSVRPIEHHLTAVVADPDPVWIESSPFKIPWVVLDQISMESAKVFIAGTRSVLWPMRGQQDVPFRFVVQVIAGHFISSVSMP